MKIAHHTRNLLDLGKKIALIGALFIHSAAAQQLCVNNHPAKRSDHVTYGGLPSMRGMVRDHIVPLCGGGPDIAANIQYQKCDKFIRTRTGEACVLGDAADKDKLEWKQCEDMCHGKISPQEVQSYFQLGLWKKDMPSH